MTPRHRFLRECRELVHLGWPLVGTLVAQLLTSLVDTVMSGQAGAREQAVVALGGSLWVPVFVFVMSVVQSI